MASAFCFASCISKTPLSLVSGSGDQPTIRRTEFRCRRLSPWVPPRAETFFARLVGTFLSGSSPRSDSHTIRAVDILLRTVASWNLRAAQPPALLSTSPLGQSEVPGTNLQAPSNLMRCMQVLDPRLHLSSSGETQTRLIAKVSL